MTDPEKLQKLFAAALRAEKEVSDAKPPPPPAPQTEPPPAMPPVASGAPASNDSAAAVPAPVSAAAMPGAPNAGLDDASSAELAALLDEQHKRKLRKRRFDTLVTLGVLLALAGGGFAWFAQSPYRVQAIREAIRDIHSLGDIQGLAAKYRAALDKVAERSNQVNQATESIGVTSKQDGEKDPNLDKEMRSMMGADGKTTGERNRSLQEKFGNGKPPLGQSQDPADRAPAAPGGKP